MFTSKRVIQNGVQYGVFVDGGLTKLLPVPDADTFSRAYRLAARSKQYPYSSTRQEERLAKQKAKLEAKK